MDRIVRDPKRQAILAIDLSHLNMQCLGLGYE